MERDGIDEEHVLMTIKFVIVDSEVYYLKPTAWKVSCED
jgi:hypothetical protein